MTTFILTVIAHTPRWVWGLLATLVVLGWVQSRDRTVSPLQLWITPVLMGAFSLWSATHAFGWHAWVQPAWLAGAALGLAANRVLIMPRRVQALADGRFAIGGSWAPMVLMVGIFLLRYASNVAIAVVPSLAQSLDFALASSFLCGLPSGLLVARALRVLAHRSRTAGLALA